MPTQKVTAGVLAGALSTIILVLLAKKFGIVFSLEEQGALQTIIVFAVQYFVPNQPTTTTTTTTSITSTPPPKEEEK